PAPPPTSPLSLHDALPIFRRHGVASLLELISASEGLPARLLTDAGGERALTDLRHVGQLLHTVATTDGLGVTALTAWLRQRIARSEEHTSELQSRSDLVCR